MAKHALLLFGLLGLFGSLLADENVISTLLHIKQQNNAPNIKQLHGRIRMNGEFWETDCKCSKKSSGMQGRACNPTKVKVFIDKKGTGMSVEGLHKYVGDVKKLDWTKVSTASFSCLDGRRKDNSLSKIESSKAHREPTLESSYSPSTYTPSTSQPSQRWTSS